MCFIFSLNYFGDIFSFMPYAFPIYQAYTKSQIEHIHIKLFWWSFHHFISSLSYHAYSKSQIQ